MYEHVETSWLLEVGSNFELNQQPTIWPQHFEEAYAQEILQRDSVKLVGWKASCWVKKEKKNN